MSALPLDRTYESVAGLIVDTCQKFYRRRQQMGLRAIDWEDITQEAHLAYWIAKASFRTGKGAKFSAWIWTKVYGRLLDMAEREDRQRTIGLDGDFEQNPSSNFQLQMWLAELSPDARKVAEMALGPVRVLTTSPHSAVKRASVKRFLRDLGWSRNRIENVIAEIKESLS